MQALYSTEGRWSERYFGNDFMQFGASWNSMLARARRGATLFIADLLRRISAVTMGKKLKVYGEMK